MKKLLTGLGAAFVLVLGVAAPAWAHVEPSIEEAPAGGFVTFTLFVGHGCEDDSPTTKLEVQMPDGVEEVTPQFLPGWEAAVDDSDGLVVTWEGGPLPHDQYQQFGLSLSMPDTPGETALFPTIQTCESGASTSWTEETPEGGEEPEHPAPAIAITEASEEGHHGGEEAEEGDEHAEEATTEAGAADSEDDGTDPLAVVALIVGALGLLAGGYAVMSSRRAS
jgi:periplasmic copper chaperone A